jgi:hypothetical protein
MSARLDRPRRLGVACVATLAAVAALSVATPTALISSAQAAGAQNGLSLPGQTPPAVVQHAALGSVATTPDNGYQTGTVLIADYNDNRIVAVAPDGTESDVPGGWNGPDGVTFDSAGNLYVSDGFNHRVVEVAPDGTQTVTDLGDVRYVTGIAVNDAGDVFVGDLDGNRVVELAADGTRTDVPFTGLAMPYGLATDADGNLFVASFGTNQVFEMSPQGVQTEVGSGFNGPTSVAVDGAGNVMVAEFGGNDVVEVAPDGTRAPVPTSGFAALAGVALDSPGNTYVSDFRSGFTAKVTPQGDQSVVSSDVGGWDLTVYEVPQRIDFTTDAPGNAVPGDTYDVAATGGDSGNPVTLSADPASARICVVTDNGDGTASVDLNRVGDCVIDADQAGTDVYAPGHATQTVTIRHRQWISYTSTPQRPHVGTTYTVTATGGGSGNPVTFTLADASEAGCSVTTEGLVTFVHATSCTIEADQTGDSQYVSAAPVFQEIAVNRGSQEVVFTSTRSQAKVGQTYRPTAVGGATGNRIRFSATGACSARHSVITFTNAGRCYVFANQNGSADYRPGKAHQTILVVKP